MNDLYLEAVKAFWKTCKDGTPIQFPGGQMHMLSYWEPSRTSSEIGRKYVYLRDTVGNEIRYNIKAKTIVI